MRACDVMRNLLIGFLRLLSFMPFSSLSGLKSKIYRMLGAGVGEHVFFAHRSFIYATDFKKVKIGDGVTFGQGVRIHCDELEVGDDTRFGAGVFAGGTILKVGSGCYILPRVYIDLNEQVTIEDDVGIGADYIFTHSVWHPVTEGGPRKFAPVHIKRGAWIPAGVFIMPGVTIGEGATVGARSLVIDDIPDGCLAVGIPAKVIKSSKEVRKILTHQEKDKIVKDILREYVKRIEKKCTVISMKEYSDEPFLSFSIESREGRIFPTTKRWVIVYASNILQNFQINYIADLHNRFDQVLFVSLNSISGDLIKNLNESIFSNLVWFSIEDRLRKKSWDEKAVSLHDFFRSRYGIRFRFHKARIQG